jgi:prephenate dehydratase
LSVLVALLGPRGTFSEEAAIKFDGEAKRILCDTIEDVFEGVIAGEANYGIVPVENSLEGSITTTLELLLETSSTICREVVLDINHCLLTLPGTKIEEIREIISHPHALAQCRKFLRGLKKVKTRNFSSTGEAAKEITIKKLKGTAAIAPKIAARFYNLSILKEGIQDQKKNQTRFFVIGLECPNGSTREKTSIVFGLKDRPGALYDVLGHFAKGGVNLTKIESRPTKKSLGEYIFYIDFIGDSEDDKIKGILGSVKQFTTTFKVLGSYSTI